MDFTYDIVSKVAVLREYVRNGETWTKELNVISWNGKEPKFDIREWNSDRTRMTKGITLTTEEASILYGALHGIINERG